MRNRYVAAIAGVCLLLGAGGAYTYAQQYEPAPPARTVAASVPLDPAARDLAAYKGNASATSAARHAKATQARKAAERAAQGGYEPATDPADGGRTPRTPVGQPCDGDPATYHVTQPDGTCSGPVHHTNQIYFDNQGNPCHPGNVPCDSDSAPNSDGNPYPNKCPSGAATSPECDRLIKHGEPNMQAPHCGDGSTPAYLRAHGVKCP